MRTAPLLALFPVLAACSVTDTSEQADQSEEALASGRTIACAVAGNASYEPVCSVERVEQEDGSLMLVVRHPDGGFRRFDVLTDGRGLATSDGAEQAAIDLADGKLDVTVGSDRYLFPATVRNNDAGE